MRTPIGGHSSHKPGDDRTVEAVEDWTRVPLHVLRDFAVDLVTRSSLRHVAALTGLGVETVRKFMLKLGEPNLSTRRRFAELYLRMNPEAVLRLDPFTGEWKARPRLLTLLPEGRFEAREALVKLFSVAKRHSNELPYLLDDLHEWMDLQVRAEYDAQDHFDAVARGEEEHEPGSILRRKPARARKRRRPRTDDMV